MKHRLLTVSFLAICVSAYIPASGQEKPPYLQLTDEALQLRKAKRLDDAISAANKAVEICPRMPDPYWIRGIILRDKKEYDSAIKDFDRALELNPRLSNVLGDRARTRYLYLNDPDGALPDFTASLELYKDKTNLLYRGQIYARKKQYELAIDDFSSAIELDPTFALAFKGRAEAKGSAGRFREAVDDYANLLKQDPAAQNYANRGVYLFYLKRTDDSLADFKRAASLDPKFTSLKQSLEAYKICKQGRLAEALSTLPEKASFTLDNYIRGFINLRAGNVATAGWHLKRVLERQPNFAAAWAERALLKYLADKDVKGALEDLSKSLSLFQDADTYVIRARIYDQQNKRDLALADLERAVKLDPENNSALRYKGVMSMLNGKPQDAIAAFTKIMSQEQKVDDFIVRGFAYLRASQIDNALKDFQKAAEIDPPRSLTHYGLGVIKILQHKPDEAISELSLGLKTDPGEIHSLCARGNLYLAEKKYKEAFIDFGHAAKIDPREPRALIGAGLANLRMQNYDNALKFFSALIAQFPKNQTALIWRAVTQNELAKYTEVIADSSAVLGMLSNETPAAWSDIHVAAQLLKADALMHTGKYRDAIAASKLLLSATSKKITENDRIAATRISKECEAMLNLAVTTTDAGTMVKSAGDYIAKADPRAKMRDGLFTCQMATRHFLFLSNLPQARVLYYAKFAEGFLDIIDSQYIHLKGSPVTRVYIVWNHQQFLDFVFNHFPEKHEARAAFFTGANSIVFGDEDGIGVLAHEIMHKIVAENMPYIDKWALEGVPAFFEQIYGYYEGEKLQLKIGLLNPLRLRELSADLTGLTLHGTFDLTDISTHEGQAGLISLFLAHCDKFKPYLELARLNGKGTYSSLVEAVFGQPFSELEKPWKEYMQLLQSQKSTIARLLKCQIFPSKADFDEAEKNGFEDKFEQTAIIAPEESLQQLMPKLKDPRL